MTDAAVADVAPSPVALPTPPRGQQLVCGVGLVLGIVLGYVSLALTPSLLAHHDLLLEALAGSTSSLVTGGALARVGRASLTLVVLAPLTSIPMYALLYWWAGRLWGDRLLAIYSEGRPRRARAVRRAESGVRRWGVWALILGPFLPVPTIVIEVLCGVAGMSFVTYLVGSFIGLMLWDGLLIGLGWAIGRPAVHVVTAISHDALWITVGLVVALTAWVVLREGRRPARR